MQRRLHYVLDPDDRYTLDACEVLYNAVTKYDADMAFGRFRRIYTYGETIQNHIPLIWMI